MSSRISDTDQGYSKRVALIAGLAADHTRIGVGMPPAAENTVHTNAHDWATVMDVFLWNEFGTANRPARSMIRGWVDENRDATLAKLAGVMRLVASGAVPKEEAFAFFGRWCVSEVRQRMQRGIAPGNQESTIRKKGSSTPLIDSGQLLQFISYVVRNGNSAV